MDEDEQKKKSTWWHVVLIILMFFLLAFIRRLRRERIIWSIMEEDSKPKTINVTGNTDVYMGYSEEASNEYLWYNSVEEALEDDSIICEDSQYTHYKAGYENKIIQLQNGKNIIYIYHMQYMEKNYIVEILLYEENGKFSTPYRMEMTECEKDTSQISYDCVKSIVIDIDKQYLRNAIYIDKMDLYYGVWVNKDEIESVTISGEKPVGIIPFEEGGKAYYLWYTYSGVINDKLEVINISSQSLQQLIEVLEIKCDKQ